MKLHSPQFERELRRRVKQAVKGSPTLKKEYRAARKYRRLFLGGILGRPLFSVMLGWLVWVIASASGHPQTALAVMSLWIVVCVSHQATLLGTALFRSNDMAALISLPVSESTIFRWQLQKFLKRSATGAVDYLVMFGALAVLYDLSPLKWCVVMAAAFLSWVFALALTGLCVIYVKRKWYTAIPGMSMLAAGAFVVLHWLVNWQFVMSLIDKAAPFFLLILPTGWPLSIFRLLLPGQDWTPVLLLIPIVAIICTLPRTLVKLRGYYVFQEMVRPKPVDVAPEPQEVTSAIGNAAKETGSSSWTSPQRGPTEIIELIQSRGFLTAPVWPKRGWLELRLWNWFTPREQCLCEFSFPNGIDLVRPWKKIFGMLAGAAGLGFVSVFLNPQAEIYIIGLGIFMTGCMMLNCYNQSGRIFQVMLNNGLRIPLSTNFPIGMMETAHLLLKVAVMQVPFVLIWGIVSGILVAHLSGFSLVAGSLYGLRAGWFIVSARFFFMILSYSSGTNDTQRMAISSAALVICVVVMVVIFVGASIAGVAVPRQSLAWAFVFGALIDAYLFFRVYAWFYNRNFFDLMSVPKR